MTFINNNIKTEKTRKIVHYLRRINLDIIDFIKMQTNYGLIGQTVYEAKNMLSSFKRKFIEKQKYDFSKNDNHRINLQNKEARWNYENPDVLNAKLKNAKEMYKINTPEFSIPSTIAFISYSIPCFDKDASQYRLFNILKILLANKFRIEFIYCTKVYGEEKYLEAFKGDIIFKHLPFDHDKYIRFLMRRNFPHVWITELWRLNYVRFITKLIESLKDRNCSSRIIIDAIDFHSKELLRKYEWTNNQEDLMRANEFFENEKTLYKFSDCLVVVSETEKEDIQVKISGINDFGIIPTIHKINDSLRTYQKRRNICFVGQFSNQHNVDAVRYFLEEIFKYILIKNPNEEFHVLGFNSEKYRKEFKAPNVKVIGSLKNLHKALTCYKLFICPFIYGAGMKGKIGDAISAGIPVVTTSIGAEGFPVRDGEECFIADSPEEFAEKCNKCLEDPVLWHNFSVKSRLMIAENFSPAAVARKLEKIFFNNTNVNTLTQ